MIGIIDYGMGNLGSVQNACRFLELPCRLIQEPDQFTGCQAVILPGVGAFGDCMAHLDKAELVAPIKQWIKDDKPFLGICLGLQILFERSAESPDVEGLGVLPGTVERFEGRPGLKVPQIGWNQVRTEKECPFFEGIPDNAYFYFVHSYYVRPTDAEVTCGRTEYGESYTSAVWKNNLFAVQFHPEKSQAQGLQLLRNFAKHIA